MVAKMAYCFAVDKYGLNQIEVYVLPTILGKIKRYLSIRWVRMAIKSFMRLAGERKQIRCRSWSGTGEILAPKVVQVCRHLGVM